MDSKGTWDLLIRGATLYDGSGAPPRRVDLAVAKGRVVALGSLSGDAHEVIDAEGLWLIPGFVDLHTHYDGQVSWDPELGASALHGVTTVVTGSCGVGFAPCKAEDRDALVALMEGVEDIPGTALHEGIRWAWESFPEYLDALAGEPRTIDVFAQVPHDALRVFVMGERALRAEVATEADIDAMRAHLRAALEAGAIGFSTGRSDNHRSAQGLPTPAHEAAEAELVGLAKAFEGLSHGVLQAVSDFDILRDPGRFHAEFDLLEAMFRAAPGTKGSVSWMQREPGAEQVELVEARVAAAAETGCAIRLQTAPRAVGVILGLEATFHPFMGHPTFRALHGLPREEQVRRLREPALRSQLLSEKPGRVSGDGSALPPLADLLLARIEQVAYRLFPFRDPPDYEPPVTASIGMEARLSGRSVMEELLDALLEEEGKALLYFPIFNYAGGNLDRVQRMLAHPAAMLGLSDAGAHVGTICDFSFPTFALDWWGLRRPEGRLPIERLVALMSGETAGHLGLSDRGILEVGRLADLNLIDPQRLRVRRPVMVADLPAGGKRLDQAAEGIVGTWKNGVAIARGGKLTGARPGGLRRAGRD